MPRRSFARGEAFDERSLVFTVGVLVFERLTERHPFGSADNAQKVARIRRGEMGLRRQLLSVSAQGAAQHTDALHGPFPEERYRSLQQLKESLARFIGQPHLAASRPGFSQHRAARPAAASTSTTGRPW